MSLNSFDELLNNVYRLTEQDDYDGMAANRQIIENYLINNRYSYALQSIFQQLKNRSFTTSEVQFNQDMIIKNKVLDNKIEQICFNQRNCAFSDDQYDRSLANKNIELVNHYTNISNNFENDAQKLRITLQETLNAQSYIRPITENDKCKAFNNIEKKISINSGLLKEELLNYLMYINVQHNKKRGRRNFSKEATAILEKYFSEHIDRPYPDEHDKLLLAEKCNLTTTQITNWFGNKRIRCMRKKKITNEKE
ncbi:Pre-B-cell leukemia transcription factor 4 [Strongyloides ratti]|uniref:Pre-B-cell leukemia transcription factor 4 n=1 Tax=Strongyloides ratti TaxID=34506 RepID=A0A090LN04_STRRB|nr:Pre-B-cell leukemia transcription factor 4 [Strongyloides ratti]CEF71126.1 Pre-B-cell leukemia transcription factor 4 [Strongyloides ratti]